MTEMRKWNVPTFSTHSFPSDSTAVFTWKEEEKSKIFNFFTSACANFSNPSTILNLVFHFKDSCAHITSAMTNNKEDISKAFQVFFRHMKSFESIEMLKDLPIFFITEDLCISIKARHSIVYCRDDYQKTSSIAPGLTALSGHNDTEFLRQVNVSESSAGEVYMNHIIDKLPCMDSQEQVIHVKRLSQIFDRNKTDSSMADENLRLIDKIKRTKFVRNQNGEPQYISDLTLVTRAWMNI